MEVFFVLGSFVVIGMVAMAVTSMNAGNKYSDLDASYEGGTGSECMACGSTELVSPADQVYLCTSCGYEGGDGMAAFQWQQKVDRLAAMSDEERAARRRSVMADGQLLLASAQSDLSQAVQMTARADAMTPITKNQRAQQAALLEAAEVRR